MKERGIPFDGVIFMRDDVYSLLMEGSPDYGKEMRVSLDWSDPDSLKELIKRRLLANEQLRDEKELIAIWRRLFVSHYKGEDSLDHLIRLSLMRPRNLLKCRVLPWFWGEPQPSTC
jgi:hypothetical protein